MASVRAFDISAAEARRIALAAQGFADRPPSGAVDARLIRRVLGRIGLLQIDSVNVLVRTQYLPLFSRLGPYPAPILETMAYQRRELFEYWGHEASFLPIALQPRLRWRMERYAAGEGWVGMVRFARANGELLERVHQFVAERGPTASGDLEEPGRRSGRWWGWSEGKQALEWLYSTGRLAVAHRRHFERHYDLPERIYPPDILALPTPPADEAQRQLLRISAKAHGIGTATDLADYFRIKPAQARQRIAELVEAGELRPVQVEGWKAEAYMDPAGALPRRIRARALLSPFDPVVWERARTERLFDFFLRIEIYTPAPKRVYGYYVLPFLVGESLVGRVDLKADRKNRALLVHGAFAEAGQDPAFVAAELAPELERMASWLGLERVIVGERGEVAAPLRKQHFRVEEPGAEPPSDEM